MAPFIPPCHVVRPSRTRTVRPSCEQCCWHESFFPDDHPKCETESTLSSAASIISPGSLASLASFGSMGRLKSHAKRNAPLPNNFPKNWFVADPLSLTPTYEVHLDPSIHNCFAPSLFFTPSDAVLRASWPKPLSRVLVDTVWCIRPSYHVPICCTVGAVPLYWLIFLTYIYHYYRYFCCASHSNQSLSNKQ